MRPVPESPIARFGDARADEIGARELQRSRPRMRATPIWAALAFGVTACVVLAGVVLAGVVYAAWVWL